MTAPDKLRERAENLDDHADGMAMTRCPSYERDIANCRREAAEWRAVADLMEACKRVYKWSACAVCDREWVGGPMPPHADDCPLAALERLIEGERDAER